MKYFFLWLSFLFFLQAEVNQTVSPIGEKNSVDQDENMKLMYQVFTYSSDLKNAYKVAKKAVGEYPESLYWHRKMAEVSQWLDKRTEAIDHYSYIYTKTHDKVLEKKILDYAMEAYQYETAAPILRKKAIEDPSINNINEMISIYNKIGTPEVAAETLEELSKKENADPFWLEEALSIYIDLGEDRSIQRVVSEISKRESIGIKTAQKLSSYYLSRQDMKKSYRTLLQVDLKTLDKNASEYYHQVSDLGWYLQDFKAAATASKRVYNLGQARLIDYERIIYYYEGKESQLIEKAALDGYKKFDKNYLYLVYLNTLFAERKYEELSKAIERIEQSGQSEELESDIYYWLMKGQMYEALKQHEKALDALNRALLLEPDSASIMATIFWFYIDSKDDKNLKKMIFDIEEGGEVDPALWLPLAVGNFSLQRSDRAMDYIKILMDSGKDDVDIKFMYAYIMQAREETGAFMKMMREIFDTLQAQKEKNPQLMKEKVFLEHYLQSGMYFIAVDDFEALLEKSERVLDERKYTEISIFWALRHNAQDRARYLAGRLAEIEPWMQLNIALNNDDHTSQLDLLYDYFTILPIRDRVVAAIRTGNISLAQTLAFEGQQENRYDYLLYRQGRDLTEANVNVVDFKAGHLNRTSIDQNYLDIRTRYYLERAWSLLANVYFAKNKNNDFENFIQMPEEDSLFDLGLRKKFMRGYVDVKAGARSAIENFYYFSAHLNYNWMSRLTMDATYENNAKAEETSYLLLGGKKDGAKAKASFQYLPSSTISLALAYHKFYSQDDIYLGDGYYSRLEWYQQIRSGYPDMAWGLFCEYGDYNEEFGSHGVIDAMMRYPGIILPETFYNVGANFTYGSMNKEYYTRVWRPYMEFSPYYNGLLDQINLSASAGYGGSIYDKDHLTVGFSYDQAVNGTQESSLELYVRYRMFY